MPAAAKMHPSLVTDYGDARSATSWKTASCVSRSGLLGGDAGDVVGASPTTPTFVLPYKRFAAPCLLALATRYLNEPRTTYRSAVRRNRCLIGYPLEQRPVVAGKRDAADQQGATRRASDHQPVVPPSLVWRMTGWLGGLALVLDKARQMILQHNPHSLCHRVAGNVPAHKARTSERLVAIQTARQLLLIIPEWEACFGCKFFPQFATRSGFD